MAEYVSLFGPIIWADLLPKLKNHGHIAGKQSDDLDKGFTNQQGWIARG